MRQNMSSQAIFGAFKGAEDALDDHLFNFLRMSNTFVVHQRAEVIEFLSTFVTREIVGDHGPRASAVTAGL